MKKILLLLIVSILAACAAITKVDGEQVINSRMAVQVTDAWNKFAPPGSKEPFDIWTQEGVTLDQLRFWAAIRPGQSLMAPPRSIASSAATNATAGNPTGTMGSPQSVPRGPRVPTFTAGMPPDQLVNLFEIMYSADGSLVSVKKVESAVFAGEKGVRFEFTIVRKSDDVQLSGVGWVSVRKDELFAATFVAPRLAFFPRLLPRAETVVRTAQIKA